MADINTAQDEALEPLEIEEDAETETEGAEQEPEDEFSIEIDGEEEAADLPAHLRKEIRERDRRLAAYEQAYGAVVKDPGTRPVYGDGSEWDYDEAKCDAAIDKYVEDKVAFDRQQAVAREEQAVQQREQQARHTTYFAKMAAIPLPQAAKEAAQEAVLTTLTEVQQASILRYAKDPAKMVVALGKNAPALASLAREVDLGAFILKMADMERNLKVVNKKKLPEPESGTIQRGSAPAASSSATKAEEALLAKGDINGFRAARKARMSKAA
jgi:hypothetical protein